MSTPTHYQLLGIPRIATQEQIRRAYRALAKTLHPDVNPSKDAAKKFAKLAAAYETLSNVETRRAYDRKLAAADKANHSAPAGSAHFTWENIATTSRGKPVDISEIDELYDTFFTRRPAKKAQPAPAPPPRTAPKPRRSRAT
jgi:DnaJ-class molecular chaperone